MVNPGAFQGVRKEFLMGEKAAYVLAVKDCYVADAVVNIQRHYLRRFPVTMDKNFEPTPEQLAAVNDNEAEPEPVEPDPTTMTPAEFEAAVQLMKCRSNTVEFRKAKIKRWLTYQYSKDNHNDGKEEGSNNPYNVMIHQLTGKISSYPRVPTAVNLWRRTQREEIECQLKVAILVGARSNKPIPKGAIQGLTQFMQPILDLVCKATGWKATFIAGGPEPAHDGHLNVLSVHSGMTTGDIKMNFGRSECAAYKTQVVPVYGNFLKKCYSPEECRSCTLPRELGYMPLSLLEDDENFSIHTVSSAPIALASALSTGPIGPPIPTSTTPSPVINRIATFTPSENAPSEVSTNVPTSVPSSTAYIPAGRPVTINNNTADDVSDDAGGIFLFDLAFSPAASPVPSPANSRASTPAPPATTSLPNGGTIAVEASVRVPQGLSANHADCHSVPNVPIVSPTVAATNQDAPAAIPLKDIQAAKAGRKRKAPPTPSSDAEPKHIRTRSVAKTIMAEEESRQKTKAKGGRGKKGRTQDGDKQKENRNAAAKDPKRIRVAGGRQARRA